MLHNKFTKAGDLPNKFTYYVSSTYFFCKIEDRCFLKIWKLDLYKKTSFLLELLYWSTKYHILLGQKFVCKQAMQEIYLFLR